MQSRCLVPPAGPPVPNGPDGLRRSFWPSSELIAVMIAWQKQQDEGPRSARKDQWTAFPLVSSQPPKGRDRPMFAQSDVARKWLVGPIVVLGFQRTADARGIAFSARLMGSVRRERRDMIVA
jgi:hypothetical protein